MISYFTKGLISNNLANSTLVLIKQEINPEIKREETSMAGIVTNPQGRQSFFDDDDPEAKFDFVKLEKTPHAGIIHQTSLQSDSWTRTLPNLQITIQGYFSLYPRVIVQFKVTNSSCCSSTTEFNTRMKR